jgi:hypothetical protein
MVSVPKPEAPKPAAAPLELELEDVRVSERPKDAGLPILEAAPPPPSGKGASKAPASKKGKLAPAGPGPGEIACPKCKTNYPDHIPFCVQCSIDLRTGLPVSGVLPGSRKKSTNFAPPEDWEEDMPFWKVVLGMIYKPHKTLGTFVYLFERQDMLAKMVVFYVLSFIFIGIGAGNMGRKIKEKIHNPDAEAKLDTQESTFKEERATDWREIGKDHGMHGTDLGPNFAYKVSAPEDGVPAGEEFMLGISIAEPGPGKGIDADVWAIETYEAGENARPSGAEWKQANSSGQLGDYQVPLRAKISDGTSWLVQVYARGVKPDAEGARHRGGFHVALKSKPGWARKVRDLEKSGGDEYGRTESQIIAAMERAKPARVAPSEFKMEMPDGRFSAGQLYFWKVVSPGSEVQMEQSFRLAVEIVERKDPSNTEPGATMDADVEVWLASTDAGEEWVFGDDDEGGEKAENKPILARLEGNQFVADVPRASVASATVLRLVIHEKGKDRTARDYYPRGTLVVVLPTAPGWAPKAYEKEKAQQQKEREALEKLAGIEDEDAEPVAAAPVKKALTGSMRVIGPIVGNILGLLFSAAIFTFAARLLGGGGSFLLCVVALAFLSGFGNILQLGLMFTKEDDAIWIGYLFFAWTFILRLLALMKVFDIDFMGAFLVNAIAGFVELYVVTLIVVAVLGTAAALS